MKLQTYTKKLDLLARLTYDGYNVFDVRKIQMRTAANTMKKYVESGDDDINDDALLLLGRHTFDQSNRHLNGRFSTNYLIVEQNRSWGSVKVLTVSGERFYENLSKENMKIIHDNFFDYIQINTGNVKTTLRQIYGSYHHVFKLKKEQIPGKTFWRLLADRYNFSMLSVEPVNITSTTKGIERTLEFNSDGSFFGYNKNNDLLFEFSRGSYCSSIGTSSHSCYASLIKVNFPRVLSKKEMTQVTNRLRVAQIDDEPVETKEYLIKGSDQKYKDEVLREGKSFMGTYGYINSSYQDILKTMRTAKRLMQY